ncbi:unnamed protein product [Candidula unifasciata]|uniref:Myb-like domain-containing protein n=1 Tax=Candidula unifasciata TaxID=100452 RepID=A0A8S3ZW80_9EUPU|nr:unnamed protein product [Candidula unifasciata]
MAEENNSPKRKSSPKSKNHFWKKKNTRKAQYISEVQNRFLVHQKWTLKEKSRLLEALKRYEPESISSIAKIVGTKSEEEVEEKIQCLRGVDNIRFANDRVDANGPDRAPIEAWIDLVQEMISFESADYSQFVPKILGLIARNEQFADSGYPELNWRHIYQFLADITEDRVDVLKLTDLEYLIVLDMMRNLGEELQKSDTFDQRQILDFKYNLLNLKPGIPSKAEKETVVHSISQALSNDFWEPEEMESLLSHAAKSAATSSAQPSSDSSTSAVRLGMTSASPARIDLQTTRASSSTQGTTLEASTSSSSSDQGSSGQQNNNSQGTTAAKAEDGNQANAGAGLVHAHGAGQRFLHPKYFTLNPLCVPTQLLAFQPKT